MLKSFNLLYYVPGMTDIGIEELDRRDREHYYKLLKTRKDEEAKPSKKE